MTAPTTWYSQDLDNREPIRAMRETSDRICELTINWSAADFARSYAPGKWNAGQILTHLAQTELGLGTRVRMALVTPGYVAQNFDQDQWVARESKLAPRAALDAFLSIGRMNRALFESLSAADRATPLSHPEYGALDVDWIIHQMAGHQIHHFRQLEKIAVL